MTLKLGITLLLVALVSWTSVEACCCCGGCGGCCGCCRICQYCCPQPPIIIQPPPALHNVCHVPCCCCRPCCCGGCCGCGGRRKRSDPLERRRLTKLQRLCRDLNSMSGPQVNRPLMLTATNGTQPLRARRSAGPSTKPAKLKKAQQSGPKVQCKC